MLNFLSDETNSKSCTFINQAVLQPLAAFILFRWNQNKTEERSIKGSLRCKQTEQISKKYIASKFITGCFKMSLHVIKNEPSYYFPLY